MWVLKLFILKAPFFLTVSDLSVLIFNVVDNTVWFERVALVSAKVERHLTLRHFIGEPALKNFMKLRSKN